LAAIRIHREHQLGLERARKVAAEWAEHVEQQFGMRCAWIEGEYSDTVEFTRSGVDGRLIVAADHFDLDAKLGFLLGAFSRTIETEIQRNLDDLLAKAPKARAPAKKAAAAKAAAAGKRKSA
jgi:putative polyhydroxyalkanoate system protein